MSFEKTISFESSEGNQYLLIFGLFQAPKVYDIPIIDLSLMLVNKYKSLNHQSTFTFLLNEAINYLNENDVVLYYYCDNKEIEMQI